MAKGRPPTSDFGTVVLHWCLVFAFLVLLATGLRIMSDDAPHAWLTVLDPVLPSEHLWWRHMIAGAALTATLGAYIVYLRSARLTARVRVDRARVVALTRPGRGRWAALSVLTIWLLLASILAAIVSGTLLYLGAGEAMGRTHRVAMWTALGSIGAHIALHLAYGGAAQLLRICRPARLVVAPPPPDLAELLAAEIGKRAAAQPPSANVEANSVSDGRESDLVLQPVPADGAVSSVADSGRPRRTSVLHAHPLANAMSVALALGATAYATEVSTRHSLDVKRISRAEAPRLDGDLSDAVWRKAAPQRVMTRHGGDFGGSGESDVEVRATHDQDYIYFAITWTDPTRSLKHLPLIKQADGWHILQRGHASGDETEFHEDKFALLVAEPGLPLIGAAIHLALRPLADKPPGAPGRGLHYTDGAIADLWQWRASHGGTQGAIENCHFGPPAIPTPAQQQGRARYAGGFVCEDRAAIARDNVQSSDLAVPEGAVVPLRLPRDPAAMTAAIGPVALSALQSESEQGRWWMTEDETQPYTATADARLPVGTLMPNVVMLRATPAQTSVRGAARWAAGRWTLELVRRLDTGGDKDVPIRSGTLVWVAAFDHAETRHTRHLRPLRLEIE